MYYVCWICKQAQQPDVRKHETSAQIANFLSKISYIGPLIVQDNAQTPQFTDVSAVHKGWIS